MPPQISSSEETSLLGPSWDWIGGEENAHLNCGKKNKQIWESERVREQGEMEGVRDGEREREDCSEGRQKNVCFGVLFFAPASVTMLEQAWDISSTFWNGKQSNLKIWRVRSLTQVC